MKIEINGKVYLLCGVVNIPMLERVYKLKNIEDKIVDYVEFLSANFPKAMTIRPYIDLGDTRSLFVFIDLDIDNKGVGYSTEEVIRLVELYKWAVPYKDFRNLIEAINSYKQLYTRRYYNSLNFVGDMKL